MSIFLDNGSDTIDCSGEKFARRLNSMMEAETKQHRDTPEMALSQPNLCVHKPLSIMQLVKVNNTSNNKNSMYFSQPTDIEDMMMRVTQSPITRDNFDDFVKSMTRFYVNTSYEKSLEVLCSTLDISHYNWNTDASGAVSFSLIT